MNLEAEIAKLESQLAATNKQTRNIDRALATSDRARDRGDMKAVARAEARARHLANTKI